VLAPISLLTLVFAACAVVAWCIVLGWRGRGGDVGYAPIAVLLTWLTASNMLRAAMQLMVLRPARAILGPDLPYDGPSRLIYFAELSIRNAWPFALLGAALLVFLGRTPWIALLGWIAASVALCWLYPELRREPQARVEAWIAAACWAATIAVGWWGHFVKRSDRPPCYIPMALMLAAQASVTLVVRFGSYPQDDWTIARIVQGTVYAGLLAYQVWILEEQQTS
jgi:hypothetical protein